jgi:methyltransferase (TIGR00027 family)
MTLSPLSATAVAIAFTRAAESARPDRLFTDPFAAGLVEASGADLTAARVLLGADSVTGDYFALRTRWLDDLCRTADQRQVVLLAAGLDTRAHRLPWRPGTRLFELDTAPVLDLKAAALTAPARCERVPVPVDLLADWPAALVDAGFRPEEPTLWLVEGLLLYLPAEARDRLLGRLRDLSAPGSRAGIEDLGGAIAATPVYAEWARRYGLPYPDLAAAEPPGPAVDTMTGAGWTTQQVTVPWLAAAHARAVPPLWDPAVPANATAAGIGGSLVDATLAA